MFTIKLVKDISTAAEEGKSVSVGVLCLKKNHFLSTYNKISFVLFCFLFLFCFFVKSKIRTPYSSFDEAHFGMHSLNNRSHCFFYTESVNMTVY